MKIRYTMLSAPIESRPLLPFMQAAPGGGGYCLTGVFRNAMFCVGIRRERMPRDMPLRPP